MTKQVSARRYLALWLPFLSADRWRTAQRHSEASPDPPDDAPVVFIEKQRGAMRIATLSPSACALGLGAGMALADARAQIPGLVAVAHDAVADAQWLERIADACERYTPSVAIDAFGAIVLDITGCTHPFGDEDALAADVCVRFAGFRLSLATADTPEAASALACFGKPTGCTERDAVHALPVAALRVGDDAATALRRAGLTCIGDLAARPVVPLAARFGKALVDALDRLLGRADSRITPRRAPPMLMVERRFAEPLGQIEGALAALGELIGGAAADMEQRSSGGRRFHARFYRSDGAQVDLVAETSRPVRDTQVVMRLFRERIDALADPLDPGFGFDMIRLAVPVLEPQAPAQLALEGGSCSEEAMAALIDRLGARLGRNRVRRFAPYDSHIPEQACFAFPAADARVPENWPVQQAGEPPLRPLHMFDPPQRIDVIADVPDGPPRRFRWRRATHDVTRHEGPERIAGEWWHKDTTPPTRDYYRIEDARGRRFWIFRHGLYGSERASPAWYIHGLFA